MSEVNLPPDVELVRHAVDYDKDTGSFTWKNPKPRTRAKVGSKAGCKKKDGYVRLSIYGREFLAHRAAWMHYYGEVPGGMIDHINRDKSDNRIANLRIADLSENNWNSLNKHSAKGCGKNPDGDTYYSLIRHRGKRIYLGSFRTEAEARLAYRVAAKVLRGEFYD